MKKKLIFSIVLILILIVLVYRATQNKTLVQDTHSQDPQIVTTRLASDNTQFTQRSTYPAIIAGDQQITITSGTSGTITTLNFDLGTNVRQGQRLATIDLTGAASAPGTNGLKSGQIRTLELAVESAEESYKRAKDAYKEDDTYANKKDKEIAEISVDSAKATLQSALDNQFVTAPITGTVIERSVSLGDSVSMGQSIATVSKTGLTKVQFYVSSDELSSMKIGDPLMITIDQKGVAGTIDIISPQADPTTKRFLIEAKPANGVALTIGSVASVSFDITRTASEKDRLIVPLSVITIGQNEAYLFADQNGTAKKMIITVHTISGETAEISSSDITSQTKIIFNGSKLVHDGDPITIAQ